MSDPDPRVPRKGLPATTGLTMQRQQSTFGMLPYVVYIVMVVHPVRYHSLRPLSCSRTQAPIPIYLTPPTKQSFCQGQTGDLPLRLWM